MGFLRIGRLGSSEIPFNGGRSQVGINFLQLGGDYPYLNFLKTAQGWTSLDNTGFPEPSTLDTDGYPTSISNGGVYTRFFIPSQRARAGLIKVDWLGIGTIYCPNASSITGSKTSATAAGGSFTFTPTTETIDLGISSIGATRVTNLRFYYADEEVLLDQGKIFGVKFKERLIEAKFAVIRFMDWQVTNTSQVTTWATRKPTSYFSYNTSEYRSSIYCGTTTESNGAYTVGAPAICTANGAAWDGVLRNKTTVTVALNRSAIVGVSAAVSSGVNTVLAITTATGDAQFSSVGEQVQVSDTDGTWAGMNGTRTVVAASAGSVTIDYDSSALTPGGMAGSVRLAHKLCSINVDSTGAKNILNSYSGPLSAGTESYPRGGGASRLCTLIFQSDLDAWMKFGGDVGFGRQGLHNGAPPELMLQLCIEIGAHAYFVAPPHAVDGDTDYMLSLATYCRANAPSWMIVRFEGPNELWNTAGGFFNTHLANTKQAVINGSQVPGGVLTTTTYNASALVYPTDVSGATWVSGTKYSKITLSTTGNSFIPGSRVAFSNTWVGVSILNNEQAYVGGINIGGDPNTITVEIVPTFGTYVSGGALTPNVGDFHNWYGGVLSKIGQDVSAAYENDRNRYQVLCGIQTGTGITSGDRANSVPRLASNSYVRRTPPAGYTATPASDWVTTLCCAQYFNPSSTTDGTMATYSAAYAGVTFKGSISGTTLTVTSIQGVLATGKTIQGIGVDGATVAANTTISSQSTGAAGSTGDYVINNSQNVTSMYFVAGQDMTAPISYAASTDTGSAPFNVAGVAALYSNWKTWAQGFGIQKMCGYEGGYSPDLSNSNGNSDTDRLKVASKLAPSLQASLTQTFNDFVGLTGGGFVAEFPSSFIIGSNPYISGYTGQVWSLLDDIYQTPNPPQWNAVVAFNNS